MSQACWLNLGSPTLTLPSNSLKAFDGHTFLPKGYLASFPITLSGKTVNMDVEVVECHLDYNLLLGCSWSYAMTAIVSSVFRLIRFPLDGKIVTVDQLSFCTPDYATLPSSIVPLIGGFPHSYVSIGTGLLKAYSLLGFFPLPPPQILNMVAMISTTLDGSIDPWIIPAPSDIDSYGDQMPLSPAELAYQAIQIASKPSTAMVSTEGKNLPPIIVLSKDLLNEVWPTDEAI